MQRIDNETARTVWLALGLAVGWQLVGPQVALAAGAGGELPGVGPFLRQVAGTVTGPLGMTMFSVGLIKLGNNVRRAGGIDGLGDGGAGVAAMGGIMGGGSWMAQQFGLTGALL